MKIAISIIFVTLCTTAIAASMNVGYPVNYRSWQHLKSMAIQPGHPLESPFGGIHHIYANPLAMRGLNTDDFADGAVFVFDLLDYIESENLIVEGERKRIDVMQFDRESFADTGGWGFETFVGNSKTERLEQDVATTCFSCHESVASSSYVFSQFRP